MLKRTFKWIAYTVVLITLLVAVVLATAYWNRDTLLDKLSAELNKDINGTFFIDKIDFTFLHNFPNFSITLHNVYLRDNQYDVYKKDILTARKVFVDVAIYPLLRKEVTINSVFLNDADIFIFKARNGDTNSDIFKKPADSLGNGDSTRQPSLLLKLQKIGFKNVSVVYSDSLKNKAMSFQFINTNHSVLRVDSGYRIGVDGDMHFDSLLFNPKGGSFLRDKYAKVDLTVQVNTHTRMLAILPSTVTYKKNVIMLKGNFEVRKEGTYGLQFQASKVNPNETQDLLNAKLRKSLSKFKCNAPVTVDVNLKGRSIPGYIPEVDVAFETKQADLQYGSLDFSSLTLDGSFTNHIDESKPKDNNNSKVVIKNFNGKMEKLPVQGRVTFTQLQDPTITLSFTSRLSYEDVNDHLDNDRFLLDKGQFTSVVAYEGKLSEYLDPTRTKYKGKLQGSIKAVDASMYYKPKNLRVDQVQLTAKFSEKLFTIDELSLNVNGSPVTINGTMKNFVPFFIQPQNKATIALNVNSPNFDLTTLTAPRGGPKKSRQQSKKNLKKMTDLLDVVYDRLEFNVDVTMSQLKFRKFRAGNFKGRVRLTNQFLQATPISMEVAGGTMHLNFSMHNVSAAVTPMTVEAQIVNADIQELFLNFNNFNQKTIQADNLRGRISADVDFSANVDENYTLITPSMRGNLDCKISDGGLMNFEPMENMSNFLFKKRDFSDVEFAELNSNFSIAGTEMDISRMEIQSSVLSLFLEGRYSFTDSTSLSVQIPLSNLKKRHKDFKPKNVGTDAKVGPSVFLHVYREKDINSKIKIDYDPFKKWVTN